MLALRLVTRSMMAASLLSVLFSGASMVGGLLLPLWFQIRLGKGPSSTGLLLVSMGLGTVAVMLVAGRLTDHYGAAVV